MAGHTLLNPPGLPAPISHYANGVKVGDTVYVSGQVALDGDGRLVGPGDVVAQTRQVLENIRRVLAAGGATLDDVVKVTVFLANIDDRPRVNEVRQAYFGANRKTPAVACYEWSSFQACDNNCVNGAGFPNQGATEVYNACVAAQCNHICPN